MKSLKFLVVLSVLAVGCPAKKDGAADDAAASSASATAANLNPALVEHVKAQAEGCTVNEEAGQAYSCKPGITDAIGKYVRETKPADFVTTLAALARKRDDGKTSASAICMLTEQFDYLGEDGKKKNATPDAVDALLAALKENAKNRATRLAKPAAQLATLAHAEPKLYAVADAHATKAAADEVYRNLLTYGRLDAFPKVQEVAKNKEHARAALEAVTRMYKPTGAEKAAVCPWAKDFLADADADVATAAGNDMVHCRGEYVDALLGEAERRLKNKQFKNPFAAVMKEPCFEFMSGVTPAAADVAQCERVYTFLEKAANDPGVDELSQGLALNNICYQRRDLKTLKMMRKYEKSPKKNTAKYAQECIKMLTGTYKLKD